MKTRNAQMLILKNACTHAYFTYEKLLENKSWNQAEIEPIITSFPQINRLRIIPFDHLASKAFSSYPSYAEIFMFECDEFYKFCAFEICIYLSLDLMSITAIFKEIRKNIYKIHIRNF